MLPRFERGARSRRTRASRANDASAANTTLAVRDSSSDLPPGAAHRSATRAPGGIAAYRVTSVDAGILHEEQPLPERAELRHRDDAAGERDAVADERRVLDVHARPLEHRLELLAHDADTAARRAAPRRCSPRAAARVSSAPQRAIQRATSQRGCECCERERSIGSGSLRGARGDGRKGSPRARDRPGAAPRSPACSRRSVASLGQLDGLRDRRVRRHASHAAAGTTPSRSRSMRSGSSRASPPRTRSSSSASSQRAPAQHPVHAARASTAGRARSSDSTRRSNDAVEQLAAAQVGAARRRPRRVRPSRRHAPPSRPASAGVSLTGRASPSIGDDGTATSRRGMRPARYASRPASTASRIAVAMRTGSAAAAMPVFISMPSTPCSITMHASDAVPTPASTMTGTRESMLDRADRELDSACRVPIRSATRAA